VPSNAKSVKNRFWLDRRFFVTEVGDGHRAEHVLVPFEPDALVEDPRGSERAGERGESDAAPCRRGAAEDRAEHFPRPASEGHQEDPLPVQFVEVLVRSERGSNTNSLGRAPVCRCQKVTKGRSFRHAPPS